MSNLTLTDKGRGAFYQEITRVVDDQERRTSSSHPTVTTGEWCLFYRLEQGNSELHNLASDPGQEKNVISENAEVARGLHQLLVGFMTDYNLAPELRGSRLELKL